MNSILGVLAATLVVVIYITFFRDAVKSRPWFIRYVEPVEIKLWQKSRTVLWARFKVLVGATLAVLIQVGQIDFTPILVFVPDDHKWWVAGMIQALPLVISGVGMVDEYLRRVTREPLTVVSMPTNAPADVQAAVSEVKIANRVAEAAVVEAKAEGRV